MILCAAGCFGIILLIMGLSDQHTISYFVSGAVRANCTMTNIETKDCIVEKDCTSNDDGRDSCDHYKGLEYYYYVTSGECEGKELDQVMTQMSEGFRCDELPASPPIYNLNDTFDECWVNCAESEFSFSSPSDLEASADKLVLIGAIVIGVGCGLCSLIMLLGICCSAKPHSGYNRM